MSTTRRHRITTLALAVGLSLTAPAGIGWAEMGGHGGGMHGGGFSHGAPPARAGGFEHHGGTVAHGGDFQFDGRGCHDHRFHDGVVIVPFGFGYYAPYAGYYPPTPYDSYCSQLSPYYDAHACWDWYGG
jgi:hypothetical protein